MPPITLYTHWNYSVLVISSIDHRLCTETIRTTVTGISIEQIYFSSEYVPMMVTITTGRMPTTMYHHNVCTSIKLEFNSVDKSERCFGLVFGNATQADNEMHTRFAQFCMRSDHKKLETQWANFSQLVYNGNKHVFDETQKKPNTVPSWKRLVKEHRKRSTTAFFNWRDTGSPRSGLIAEATRFSRSQFNNELRHCRSDE